MRLHKISYSQYAMWKNCPHQWKLNYYDGLKVQSDSIHTVFGTAIHHAIQESLTYRYVNTEPYSSKPNIHVAFHHEFKKLFIEKTITNKDKTKTFLCDKPTLLEFVAQGTKILNYIVDNWETFFPTDQWELLGCEIPLEVDLNDNVYFVGFLDIVIINKATGQVKIIDLKTSSKGWRYEKKSATKLNQLLLYKRYYAKQFETDEDNIDVVFVIMARIPEGPLVENFVPPQTQRKTESAYDDMMQFVNTTFAENGQVIVQNLVPTPSTNACRFCPFSTNKTLCEVGISS